MNDAARLAHDLTFRLNRLAEDLGAAVLTSRLQPFEPEVMTEEGNLAGLAALNLELLARVEDITSRRRVVLGRDN